MGEIERYRDRAEQMRVRADAARSPEVAANFRELALQWDTLADHVEAAAVRAEPWPELDERT